MAPWQRLLLKHPGERELSGLSWQLAQVPAWDGLVLVCDDRQPAGWFPPPVPGPPAWQDCPSKEAEEQLTVEIPPEKSEP